MLSLSCIAFALCSGACQSARQQMQTSYPGLPAIRLPTDDEMNRLDGRYRLKQIGFDLELLVRSDRSYELKEGGCFSTLVTITGTWNTAANMIILNRGPKEDESTIFSGNRAALEVLSYSNTPILIPNFTRPLLYLNYPPTDSSGSCLIRIQQTDEE
jgi:hypothetical protein